MTTSISPTALLNRSQSDWQREPMLARTVELLDREIYDIRHPTLVAAVRRSQIICLVAIFRILHNGNLKQLESANAIELLARQPRGGADDASDATGGDDERDVDMATFIGKSAVARNIDVQTTLVAFSLFSLTSSTPTQFNGAQVPFLQGHSSVLVGNKLYLIGGIDPNSKPEWKLPVAARCRV